MREILSGYHNRTRRRVLGASLAAGSLAVSTWLVVDRLSEEPPTGENKALENPWRKLGVIKGAIRDDKIRLSYPSEHSLEKPTAPRYEEMKNGASVVGTVVINDAVLFINGCNTGPARNLTMRYDGEFPPAGKFTADNLTVSFWLPTDWSEHQKASANREFQTAEQLRDNPTYDDCFYERFRDKLPQLPDKFPNPFD